VVIDYSKYVGKSGAKRLRTTKKRAVFERRGFILKGSSGSVQYQTSPGKSGLKASDLIENKRGKIVSKVKSKSAKKTFKSRAALVEQASKMKAMHA